MQQPNLDESWSQQWLRMRSAAHQQEETTPAFQYAGTTEDSARVARLPVPETVEPNGYTWQVHGKPVAIHLKLDVVDRLQRDLFEPTFYGTEVTGILIGRTRVSGSRSIFVVEDYELILDQSAGFSLAKQKQLADLTAKWNAHGTGRRAIGLFRSQTRGWLALSEQDVEAAKCLFPRADNIFLVVRSSPGTAAKAGFFFWEGKDIRANESYCEFPFDSQVLNRHSINRIHILNSDAETLSGENSHKPGRSVRTSWLTVALTGGLALASTMTCVALRKANGNPATVSSASSSEPSRFKVDYHGQKIAITMNQGLPSDLERGTGPLSDRQKQLLRYFAQDVSNRDIASRLGITPEAVEIHKQALSHKLGVTGEAGLVRYAIKAGLVEP